MLLSMVVFVTCAFLRVELGFTRGDIKIGVVPLIVMTLLGKVFNQTCLSNAWRSLYQNGLLELISSKHSVEVRPSCQGIESES